MPRGLSRTGTRLEYAVIMAKASIKTTQTEASVEDFLDKIEDPEQRSDSRKVIEIMQRLTGEEPKMWGPSIVGFGFRTIKSPATGREVDWLDIGFSPRKAALTLYVLNGMPGQDDLLAKLGKHKTGKGCLYIKRLSDVDEKVLEKVIAGSIKKVKHKPKPPPQ